MDFYGLDDRNQGISVIIGEYEQDVEKYWILGLNGLFGRNNKVRGNTEEEKEKDFTINYDKVFNEIIFD